MSVISAKAAVYVGEAVYKNRKKIVIIILSFLLLLFSGIAALINEESQPNTGTAKVNKTVMAWKPVVEEYAQKYGISDYVEVILAIMMVETGGSQLDIMQSSESLGLPPNTISDPIQSIDIGVRNLSSVMKDAKKKGLDFWTPIQSYNYGSAFNDYVSRNGKKYTFDLATAFAQYKSGGIKVKYSNPIADFNGNWRYKYGNMYYVLLVQQYFGNDDANIGNVNASALGAKDYQKLMNEVTKYKGWSYVWGGANPSVGFDCSGLVQYNYKLIGYNLPRTAQEQYNATIKIANPQPGDLIFFKGTNSDRPASSITHVGIYVDEKRMFHSGTSGIGFVNWTSSYYKNHFAGFGRVVH